MSVSEFQFHSFAIRELHLAIPRTFAEIAKGGGLTNARFGTELQRFVLGEEIRKSDEATAEVPSDDTVERVYTTIRLQLRLRWEGGGAPIALEMTADGQFSASLDMATEDRVAMCSVNAPALLYSQLRPVVRVLMAESGHPGFNLPLTNVAELFRDQPLERWPGSDASQGVAD
jgi:preprotein translocase subunit SecB